MASSTDKITVYLETGKKRTFAGAIEWPGWTRSGKDEESALQSLLQYAPRYAHVVRGTRLGFHTSAAVSAFSVVERLEGNTTTDFGSPGLAPSADARKVGDDELARLQTILKACWQALDTTAKRATGKALTKGPRGGGRDLSAIMEHVQGAEIAYLGAVGWKPDIRKGDSVRERPGERMRQTREAVLEALAASARGEIPGKGPRGGTRWSARYFARRVAWHILDHAWEIQDRTFS